LGTIFTDHVFLKELFGTTAKFSEAKSFPLTVL
jgi:hypothetical protein